MDGERRNIYSLIEALTSRRGAVVLSGANGAGKTIFALQIAAKVMAEGRRCIYVVTTMSPQSLLDTASSVLINLKEQVVNGLFVIVDCYSRFAGSSSIARYTLGPESSLLQLRETILQASQDVGGYHLVVDDLSSLLAYTPSETAFKFFQAISADIRRTNSSGVLIIVPDILETRLTNLLYSLADGVVEMALEEMGGALRRFVRIRFLRGVAHSTEWSEYLIGPGGIEILGE